MENKQKIPQVRFKGFTDAWEQRKFSELTEIRSASRVHKEEWQSSGVPFYRSSDVMAALNGTENEKAFISEELYEKLSAVSGKLEKGDVLVTGGGSVGKPYIVPNNEPLYTKDADLLWIKNNENLDPYFVYTFFFSPTFTDYLNSVSHVGTIAHYTITQLGETPITLPCVSEQQKIGDYFRNLDSIITLHQRKCDTLQKLKKSMLQKMFPKNDSLYPEIRFEGFTDAWEQRKVGEWGNFYYGHSCPKWSVTEDATTPCIRYGEMYTKFGCKIDRVYSYTNIPKENLKFSKGTEVLVPRVGEDPMDYNHCTWLSLANVAIGEMISVYNTEQNPLFTAIMFNATLKYEFAKRVEGGSVTNLYYEKLLEIPVSFPNIEEQKKIASLFENFDHLITLHQRKLETLKKLKKSMLQKMFI